MEVTGWRVSVLQRSLKVYIFRLHYGINFLIDSVSLHFYREGFFTPWEKSIYIVWLNELYQDENH